LGRAADAAAKLVELGEAEALGVFDDHHGGVGDVDADFHDGCRHEDLGFILRKRCNDFFFFVAERRPCKRPSLSFGKTSRDNRSNSSTAAFSSSFDSSMTG